MLKQIVLGVDVNMLKLMMQIETQIKGFPEKRETSKACFAKFIKKLTHWLVILNFLEINKIALFQCLSKRFRDTVVPKFLEWADRRKSVANGLNYWKNQRCIFIPGVSNMCFKMDAGLRFKKHRAMVLKDDKKTPFTFNLHFYGSCWMQDNRYLFICGGLNSMNVTS